MMARSRIESVILQPISSLPFFCAIFRFMIKKRIHDNGEHAAKENILKTMEGILT